MGFTMTRSNSSLFIYKHDNDMAYLLLYADDIVLMTSSSTLLQHITRHLSNASAMKDLGSLHYFLGIHVQRTSSGFFLHQAKYAEEVLGHTGMMNCKLSQTPVDTCTKSLSTDGTPTPNASFYHNIVGAL
jgi:hypothetical protein